MVIIVIIDSHHNAVMIDVFVSVDSFSRVLHIEQDNLAEVKGASCLHHGAIVPQNHETSFTIVVSSNKHAWTQHGITEHYTSQHNTTQHNTKWQNSPQHSTGQHNITQPCPHHDAVVIFTELEPQGFLYHCGQ